MADNMIDYGLRFKLKIDTEEFNTIREKIKKIDMGEYIQFSPQEAKKLKRILQDEINDAGDQASALGRKIQEGINKGLSNVDLQKIFDIDNKKLKESMEIVDKITALITKHSGSDSWLKDGKGFLSSLTDSEKKLTDLEASLGRLDVQFKTIDNSLKTTIANLNELTTKVQDLQNIKPTVVAPSFDFTKADKEVEKLKRKLNDLDVEDSKPIDIKVTIGDEIGDIVKELESANKEIKRLKTDLGDTDESDINGIKELNRQLADQYLIKANHYKKLNKIKEEYSGLGKVESAFTEFKLKPKSGLNKAKAEASKYIEEIAKMSSSSGQEISPINISVALPTDEDIRAQINKEIGKLNQRKDAIQAIKLTIDDTISNKDSFKKATDSIIDNFKSIDGIVEKTTSSWREKILNAFKADKKEIDLPFTIEATSKTVYNELEKFFQDNEIDIHINKEVLTQEIKDAIEKGGVSNASLGGGGGTVNIDQKSLASAVATGLKAFLTGDFTPLTGDDKPTLEGGKPEGKTKKSFYLDPENAYNQEVAEMFKEVMVYAQGKYAPNQKVKSFFEVKGVNVDEMAKGSTIQLVDTLSQLVDQYGNTIVDEFSELIPRTRTGKNNLLNNFKVDLRELIKTNNVDQVSVDEHTRQAKRDELFDDYVKKAQLSSGIGKLIGLANVDSSELKVPETTDIEFLVSYIKELINEKGLNDINQQVVTQQKLVDEAKKNFSQNTLDNITQQIKDKTSELNKAKSSGDASQIATLESEITALETEQAKEQVNKQNLRLAESKLDTLERKQTNLSKVFNNYKPILDALETLQEARSLMTDTSDEEQKKQFLVAIQSFKSNASGVYGQLMEYLRAFKWGLDIKGFKNEHPVNGPSGIDKLLKMLDGDLSRIDQVHMYKAPESVRRYTETQDRTNPLFRDTKADEFKPKENTSRRWENDNTAKKEAERRAVETTKLVKESEKKLADAAQIEANIERQITEKTTQIAELEKQIAANQDELNNISQSDKKEAQAAKRRLKNIDERYKIAKAEKDAADEWLKVENATDYSDRDKQEAEYNVQIKRYKKWMKNPEKYREDIAKELYDKKITQTFNMADDEGATEAEAKRLLKSIDNQIKLSQGDEKQLKRLQAAREEQIKIIEKSQQRTVELEQTLDELEGKRDGSTEEYRVAFLTDVQNVFGSKVQAIEYQKSQLRTDNRPTAEKRVKQANAKFDKIDAERNALIESNEMQTAERIARLEAENKELRSRIKTNKKDVKDLGNQAKNLPEVLSTSEMLSQQESEVDTLTKEVNSLEEKIKHSQKEADKVKEFVDKTMEGKDYKKIAPKEINYNKKALGVFQKKGQQDAKTKLLDDVLNGTWERAISDKSVYSDLPIDKLDKFDRGNNLINAIKSILEQGKTDDAELRYVLKHFKEQTYQLQAIDEFLLKNPGLTLADKENKQVSSFLNSTTGMDRYLEVNPEVIYRSFTDAFHDKKAREFLQVHPDEDLHKWLESTLAFLEQEVESLKPEIVSMRDDASSESNELASKVDEEKVKLKEKFKKYITSLFGSIETKIKSIDSGKLSKEQEGLVVTEISEIFKAIDTTVKDYGKHFTDQLLTEEQQALVNGKDDGDKRRAYSSYGRIDQPIYDDSNKLRGLVDGIKNSERYSLLQTRQAELLRDISNTKGDTSGLEKELNDINTELGKYQQLIAMGDKYDLRSIFADDIKFSEQYKNSIAEIITLQQKVDLDKAKGVSKSKLDKSYTEIDSKQSELDTLVYDSLKAKQSELLKGIKSGIKNGESTDKLRSDLEKVNQELVELEANKRLLEQTSVSGKLYHAGISAVQDYIQKVRELIKAEQELAAARAAGENVSNFTKEKNKKQSTLNKYLEDQWNSRINTEASTSPRAQALAYIRETDKAYQDALEKRNVARSKKRKYEYQLEEVQSDDRYSTSWQYKKHQREVKSRLTDEYVISDKYKSDRKVGQDKAEQEFRKYLEDTFGPEKAQNILYEFLNNQRGKHADKIDPSKFKESYGDLMREGMGNARAEAEEEFKNTPEYQQMLADSESLFKKYMETPEMALRGMIGNMSQDQHRQLQHKFALIDEELAENIKFLNETTEQNYPLLEEEVKKLLGGASAPKNMREYGKILHQARNNLIQKEQDRTQQLKQNAIGKFVKYETQAPIQNAIDDYVRQYFDRWIESAFTDDVFGDDAEANKVRSKFKELLEENVYNIVSNFASNLKIEKGVVKDMNGNDVDIRQEVIDRLIGAIGNTSEIEKSANDDISFIESQRKNAMKFGGVGYGEFADAEVLREQAILKSKLTLEMERQRDIAAEIARLEKQGDPDGELGKLNGALDQSNATISKLQMLVNNRDALMELQHQALKDEKVAETWDLDKQKLYYENKKVVAEADLESGDATAQKRIDRYANILENIGEKIYQRDEAEREKNKPVNLIAEAFRKAIGGKGGFTFDATGIASEQTLAQILAVVTGILNMFGGKVVEDPAYKEAAATMRALEEKYGGKPNDKIVKTEELKSAKNSSKTTKYPDEFNFVDELKKQSKEVAKYNKDTTEYITGQAKLYKLLWDYKNSTPDLKKIKNEDFFKQKEIKNLKLDPDLIKAEDRKKAFNDAGGTGDVEKLARDFVSAFKEATSTVVSTTDKKTTGEKIRFEKEDYNKWNKSKKIVDNYKPQIVPAEGDGDLGVIAKDETLVKILDVLNKIKTEGIKKGGTKAADKKEEKPKKSEAELIKERALKDQDAILGIAANSKIKTKYTDLVKELNSSKEIGEIKALAQRISALGFNIMKESAEWEYKTTDANRVYDIKNPNAFGKKRNTVRKSMERLAQNQFNPEGKEYKFLDFDGTKLSYQLTDVRGNVEKVTMEWSELNNQVAITSDRIGSKLSELEGKIQSFKSKFENAVDTGYLADNDKDLTRFKDKIVEIQNKITEGASIDDIDKLRNDALRIADEVNKKTNKNKRAYSGTAEINAVERQKANMDAYGMLDNEDLKMVEQYKQAYDALITKHNEFKTAGTLYDPDNQKALQSMAIRTKNLGKELEKSVQEAEQLKHLVENSGSYKGKNIGNVFELYPNETQNLEQSMKSYLNSLNLGSVSGVKFDNVHQRLTATLRTSDKTVSDLEMKYNEATNALYLYQKQERESLTGIPAFIKGFQSKIGSIMQYTASMMSIHRILSELRRAIQYVKEIDSALTELRKVTDETKETYDEFLKTAAKTGSVIGSTISEVTQATATFAKLGYSIEQATEMAESALVYQNVGDNIASAEDAAESIISTMKGFGLEASESMRIVDRFNEVGNRFSITSQGIGEALKLSASALNEGGNSLDESIGLITAANEVVQDPNTVGTALKTLTLRLRGAKTELEDMGEDVADMATTTSQLQAKLLALTGGQVNIMLDENTFKNSTQILREMADAWEDMTDVQRASALELMGGKRQANILSALIQNFDTVEKVIEASSNSAGSALQENEKYLDSIQGKLDQFNNAVQSLWQNLLGSDIIKNVISWVTKIIKSLDTTRGKIFAIVKAVALLMAYKKVNPFEWIKGINDTLTKAGGFKHYLASLFGIEVAMQKMTAETMANTLATTLNDEAKTKAALSTLGFTSSTESLTIAQRKQAIESLIANKSINGLKDVEIQAIAASWGLKTSVDATTGSVKVLDTTTKSFLTSNWVGWILLAISVIISLATWLMSLSDRFEKLTDKIKDARSEISSLESDINHLNSELETTRDRIAELIAMPSLSLVDQQELENLKKQNAELERQLQLKKDQEEAKRKQLIKDTDAYLDSTWNDGANLNKKYTINNKGIISKDKWYTTGVSTQDALKEAIDEYEHLTKLSERGNIVQEVQNALDYTLEDMQSMPASRSTAISKIFDAVKGIPDQEFDEFSDIFNYAARNLDIQEDNIIGRTVKIFNASKDALALSKSVLSDGIDGYYEEIDKRKADILSGINEILYDDDLEGLEYGMSDKIDEYLDATYGLTLKLDQIEGKSVDFDAINNLFNQTSTKELQKVDTDIRDMMKSWDEEGVSSEDQIRRITEYVDKIDETAHGYNRLNIAMDTLGITAKRIAEYFVLDTGAYDSSTIAGITNQYSKAVEVMEKLKSTGSISVEGESFNFDDLFSEDKEGKFEARADKFAAILKGLDDNTRETFMSLSERIKNDGLSWDDAIKSLNLSGLIEASKIIETQFTELNKNVFKGISDDLSGFIDTFSELTSALEDVAGAIDLLDAAEKQMDNSGRVSIKTALELIESTDRWNEVLTISGDTITLNANAEDILVQSKLNTIKANIQEALSAARLQLAQLGTTDATLLSAEASDITTDAYKTYTDAMNQYSASIAGFGAAMGALLEGDFGGIVDKFRGAYDSTLTVKNYEATQTSDGLRQKIAELQAQSDMLSQIDTTGDFKNNYEYEKTPGDKYDSDSDGIDDDDEDKVQEGWDKLLAKYENQLALITNERDLIEAEIDRMEAQGGKASAQYYDDLIRGSAEEKALLEEKKTALENYLKANAGAIDQDTWTDYNNEINETSIAIKECEVNTLEWAEALREIDTHYFEQITNEISRVGEELEFVNSLLEDEEVADENGNWSSAALTRMGMYTQQMEQAAAEAKLYQDEIDKINEQYDEGALSEEQYQEKLSDLVSGQQNAIQSYEDAKDSIVDMNEARIDAIKEGIDKEIEAYEDLIDAKKEELDAERDLHDFRENIKDQTKEISALERRIASLSGSSAASDIAERRRLEAQLMEAKEGLNSSYYDHSRDAQSQALDEESEAFQLSKERYIEQLEEQLKDTETLIQNSIMDVMLNADTVYNELNILADTYGVTLSDELTQPWKDASNQALAWKEELKESMTSGEYATLIGEGGAITAFANGVATKLKGSWTQAQTAAQNYAGYLTGAELKNRFANTLTGFGNQIQSIIDKWNGVKAAADAAYTAQTRKVTVGGTGSGATDTSGGGGGNYTSAPTSYTPASKPAEPTVKLRGLMKTSRDMILGPKSFVDENTETINGIKYYRDSKTGYYYKISDLDPNRTTDLGRSKKWAIPKGTWFYTKHAKGTMGTTRDEWAITDEPQFGDELVMYATPEGTLSYMRAGSTVVPADITANLVEWGKLNPDMLNLANSTSSINMISNAINKPEINLSFEALVKAERIDENTLPEVKKFVQREIDNLVKQMNYAIKGKGAR